MGVERRAKKGEANGLTVRAFHSPVRPTWCPGCGDFGILSALKKAFVELERHPHEIMIVSGIGCGSKLPDYIHANGFMTIHGRPLAVATGIALANPDLELLVVNGDGDAYGIGGNHFLHTCRRNIKLTHIVENNQIYALTKGQYSPTSDQGFQTTTSPDGAPEQPINPTHVAFAAGATFIARTFAGDPNHMVATFVAGMRHPGYALIDVLQPCVTFNKVNTYDWYRERLAYMDADDGYDPRDRVQAGEIVQEWGQRIPVGILYRNDEIPTYSERVPALKHGPPARIALPHLEVATFDELKGAFV